MSIRNQEPNDNILNCHPDGCTSVGYEYVNVVIPFEVRPDTSVGCIEAECVGKPTVQCEQKQCRKELNLIITQRVKITVPLKVGVSTSASCPEVRCLDPQSDNRQ